jgi:hypothetical protein
MDTFNPALGSVHVQPAMPQIDLRPANLAEFSSTKAMSIRQQDRCSIPGAIASSFPRSIDQSINFHLR